MTLVLSGSGPKYPAHVGAALELKQQGAAFAGFVGTSGGSLVAALLASGMTDAEVLRVSRSINPQTKLDGGVARLASSLVLGFRGMPKGLYAGDAIIAELRRHLPKTLGDCPHALRVVVFDLELGRCVVFTNRKETADGVDIRYAPTMDFAPLIMASMALPIIFDGRRLRMKEHDGVERDQGFFADGGIGRNFAVDLFGRGRDVIGVRFVPSTSKRIIRSFVDVAAASIDGMIEAATREHLDDATYAQTITIADDSPLTDFNITPERADALIDLGRRSVHAWMARRAMQRAADAAGERIAKAVAAGAAHRAVIG